MTRIHRMLTGLALCLGVAVVGSGCTATVYPAETTYYYRPARARVVHRPARAVVVAPAPVVVARPVHVHGHIGVRVR